MATSTLKLEVLKTLKQQLKYLGILRIPISYKITCCHRVFILCFVTFFITQSAAFSILEAEDASEFPEPFCYALGFLLSFIWYGISLWKRNTIEYFLTTIEDKIRERKLQ